MVIRRAPLRSSQVRDALATGFLMVVVGHWLEHVVQAVQIYGLGRPAPQALGALGSLAPGMVRSEWLHWIYNAALFGGIALLLPRFVARARTWWFAALATQGWHLFEHTLLLGQAITGHTLLSRAVPTSVGQLVVPRVELHLLYNTVVTALLLAAAASRWAWSLAAPATDQA